MSAVGSKGNESNLSTFSELSNGLEMIGLPSYSGPISPSFLECNFSRSLKDLEDFLSKMKDFGPKSEFVDDSDAWVNTLVQTVKKAQNKEEV